jgi:hypothetical protein
MNYTQISNTFPFSSLSSSGTWASAPAVTVIIIIIIKTTLAGRTLQHKMTQFEKNWFRQCVLTEFNTMCWGWGWLPNRALYSMSCCMLGSLPLLDFTHHFPCTFPFCGGLIRPWRVIWNIFWYILVGIWFAFPPEGIKQPRIFYMPQSTWARARPGPSQPVHARVGWRSSRKIPGLPWGSNSGPPARKQSC